MNVATSLKGHSPLGLAIHMHRWNRQWSLRDLASRTGLSASTLSRMEHGASPRLNQLEGVAAAFDTTVDDLRAYGAELWTQVVGRDLPEPEPAEAAS